MEPIMISKFVRSLLARPHAILLASLLVSVPASRADLQMKVNDSGYLDAQGFSLLDRGTVIQFTGPGRLVLNGHRS